MCSLPGRFSSFVLIGQDFRVLELLLVVSIEKSKVVGSGFKKGFFSLSC